MIMITQTQSRLVVAEVDLRFGVDKAIGTKAIGTNCRMVVTEVFTPVRMILCTHHSRTKHTLTYVDIHRHACTNTYTHTHTHTHTRMHEHTHTHTVTHTLTPPPNTLTHKYYRL